MDSQDKDQSKWRRRDEALARRVGEALNEMDARNAGDCPDGEILAAYAEQALDQAEAAKWEGHFASCSRCRKILLVLDTSAGTLLAEKEVAPLEELVLGVRAPVEVTERTVGNAPQRFWDWSGRWLAPALGVAAVLVVLLVMWPPWRAMNRSASPSLVAQAPKQEGPPSLEPAQLDRLSRLESPRDQKALPAPPPQSLAEKAPSSSATAGAPAEPRAEGSNALKKFSPSAGAAGGAVQSKEKTGPSSEQVEVLPQNSPAPPPPAPQAKTASGAALPAPLPAARAQADATTSAAPEVPRSTSQTVTVTEAAPQVETTNGTLGGTIQQQPPSDLPLNGRAAAAFSARSVRVFSALMKSPSGSILWRAGRGGLIERSTDAGKTWISQTSPAREDWLAGAAVSDTVCWVVGRNGAIARTVDGERWERVAPPAPAASEVGGKLPDFTGVTASDALKATITAGNGRRYATQDGGKTWQAQ